MAESSEQHLEAIRQNVHCPVCDYNLRGLFGDEVTCPECGQLCDVARLVTVRWDRSWYHAPGLDRMMVPGLWVLIGGIMLGAGAFFIGIYPAIAIFVVGWIGLMGLAWWHFKSMEGIWLALVGHAILITYTIALMGMFMIAASCTASGQWGMPSDWRLVFLGLLLIGVGVAGRFSERLIASRCIRLYLKRKSAALEADE